MLQWQLKQTFPLQQALHQPMNLTLQCNIEKPSVGAYELLYLLVIPFTCSKYLFSIFKMYFMQIMKIISSPVI